MHETQLQSQHQEKTPRSTFMYFIFLVLVYNEGMMIPMTILNKETYNSQSKMWIEN